MKVQIKTHNHFKTNLILSQGNLEVKITEV